MPINPNLGVPLSESLREVCGFIVDVTPQDERLYAPVPPQLVRSELKHDDLAFGILRAYQEAPDEQRINLLPQLGFVACNKGTPDAEQCWHSAAQNILVRPHHSANQLYIDPSHFSDYKPTLLDLSQLDIFSVGRLNVTPQGKTSFVPASNGLRARNDWAEFTLEHTRPTRPRRAVMRKEPTLRQLDIARHEAVATGLNMSSDIIDLKPSELLAHDMVDTNDRFRVPLFYLRKLAALGIVDNLGPTDTHYDELNLVRFGDKSYRVDVRRAAGDFGPGMPTLMLRVGPPDIKNSELSHSKDRWQATFFGPHAGSDEQYRQAIDATFL